MILIDVDRIFHEEIRSNKIKEWVEEFCFLVTVDSMKAIKDPTLKQ